MVASGILLAILGVWIVLRTVRGDRTLPDLILGKTK